MPAVQPIDRDATVYVAGHRGLAGSAIWRELERAGFTKLVGATSSEVDLRNTEATRDFFATTKPDVVVLAAAKVGGIIANSTLPHDFLVDNLRIQMNVIESAHATDVSRLLFLGSSCIYPKFADQPIHEDSLLTGSLEETNAPYAIAKIAGITHLQALRKQYGRDYISAMPTNLYGPGDNFDPVSSHVLPGLIRRYHNAKVAGDAEVTNWGTGSPLREFLHVDDLASACLFLLDNYSGDAPVNVGYGSDLTIAEVSEVVARTVGFEGKTIWDPTKPDGTPRKLLDSSTIRSLGWEPKIDLDSGLASTYEWFLENAL